MSSLALLGVAVLRWACGQVIHLCFQVNTYSIVRRGHKNQNSPMKTHKCLLNFSKNSAHSLPVPSKLVNFLLSQLTADFLSSKLRFLQAIVGNAPFGHVELFFEWWHRNWHLPHHEDVPIQSWNGQALDEEFQFLAGSETTSNDINAGNGS